MLRQLSQMLHPKRLPQLIWQEKGRTHKHPLQHTISVSNPKLNLHLHCNPRRRKLGRQCLLLVRVHEMLHRCGVLADHALLWSWMRTPLAMH